MTSAAISKANLSRIFTRCWLKVELLLLLTQRSSQVARLEAVILLQSIGSFQICQISSGTVKPAKNLETDGPICKKATSHARVLSNYKKIIKKREIKSDL